MGYFVVRRTLVVRGGSILFSNDTNLYRSAANTLKTDDALTVAGALTSSAHLAATGGSITLSGTPCILPHGTSAPSLTQNGEVKTYDPTGAGKVSFRIGGTIYTMALPSATHGTLTITVGNPP